MDWTYLLLLILLSLAGFYAGWRYVGRMTSRWWIVIALACRKLHKFLPVSYGKSKRFLDKDILPSH